MQTKVRVVGSGYTMLHWKGAAISFLDQFTDRGQTPVGNGGGAGGGGAGWEAIIPLGADHPVEIATSRVLGAGSITASIRELWNEEIWQQLGGLADAANVVDVWRILEQDPQPVTCYMNIKTPGNRPNRRKTYHNCVITQIDTGDVVQIGTLSVSKNIEIAYTHATYPSRG